MRINAVMAGNRLITADNIKALSLAMLLLTYAVLALSVAQVHYFETLHRITFQQVFDQNLFGSTVADAVAAVGFTLLFIGLSIRSIAFKIGVVAGFAAIVIIMLMSRVEFALVAALATLPALLRLLASAYSNRLRATNAGQIALAQALQEPATDRPAAISTDDKAEKRPWYSQFRVDPKTLGIAFLLIIIIIEAGALVKWISLPLVPSTSGAPVEFYDKDDPTWKFASLESGLYHSFALLSPILLVLLAFAFLYKHLDIPRRISRRLKRVTMDDEVARKALSDRTIEESQYSAKQRSLVSVPSWVLLILALSISVLVAIYPHMPGINPAGSGISTDEQFYVNSTAALRAIALGPQDGVLNLLSIASVEAAFTLYGDRPLSLLSILALGDLAGLPDATIVRYLPVLLAPLLVGTSHILARNGSWFLDNENKQLEEIERRRRRDQFAGFVAILAALSPQVVVGIYGGFLANWMGLISALFAILFFIRIWNHGIKWATKDSARNDGSLERLNSHPTYGYATVMVDAFGLVLTLVLTMFYHVYTWGYVVVAMGLFLVASVVFSKYSSSVPRTTLLKVASIVALLLGLTFAVDYAKSGLFSTATGIERDSIFIANNLTLENFNSRWDTLSFTSNQYLGGFLGNPIFLILPLLWILFRAKYSVSTSDRIMICLFLVLCLPILFGNVVLQARMLYDIPTFIPAAALILMLGIKLQDYRLRGSSHFPNIIMIAVTLAVAVYVLRALANTYLVLPEGFVLEQPFLIQ